MTLKQLEAFYWAATCASFLIAAERLHVSQSSLSKRISELEAALGKTLFDRGGHRAALTETGRLLLPLARRMLGLADEVRGLVADDSGVRGLCRLGVGEFSALTWLPDLVRRARAKYPGLHLEPRVDVGAALEHGLENGELDFAVIADFSSRSAIASLPIADLAFGWAAAPALVGHHRTVDAKLLRDTALITMPAGAGAARALDRWMAQNNLEAGRRLTCNNLGAIAELVAAGVGLALLPSPWLDRMARRGALVPMRSSPPVAPLRYTFQWRRDDTRPVVARMREMVRETADFSKPNPRW